MSQATRWREGFNVIDDLWYGYLHMNGVVHVSRHEPKDYHDAFSNTVRMQQRRPLADRAEMAPVTKVVEPFKEDIADVFEGDQKMVRRRIMAAIYNTPLEQVDEATN